VSVTITVAIPCPHCGEPARLEMTVEQALAHASDVVAAAAGLAPVELPAEVRGEG
jgi:phage terminase large subunit GpA-like protein